MATIDLPGASTFRQSDRRYINSLNRHATPAHLETSDGTYLGPCQFTGPEILRLAEQGRALWNALSQLLAVIPPLPPGLEWDEAASARAVAASVLGDTAATFDHNEPAEPVHRHNPERPIPLVPDKEGD